MAGIGLARPAYVWRPVTGPCLSADTGTDCIDWIRPRAAYLYKGCEGAGAFGAMLILTGDMLGSFIGKVSDGCC